EELDALIEQSAPKRSDLWDVLRGGLGMQIKQGNLVLWALVFGFAGVVITGAAVFVMRGQYVSEALVRLQTPPGPILPVDDERKLVERVLASQNLLTVMKTFGVAQGSNEEESIRRMREAIQIQPAYHDRDMSVLSIRFANPDRNIAQRVAQDLVARV